MDKAKIRKLINYLHELDESRFKMQHWLVPIDYVDVVDPFNHAINSLEELERFRSETPKDDWCGTAGCLAGHTCLLFSGEGRDGSSKFNHIPNAAARILGLTHEEQIYLFTPRSIMNLEDVTLTQAIVVLDHFLKTGEIDWTLDG